VLPGIIDSHIYPSGILNLETRVLETWFRGKNVYKQPENQNDSSFRP
jgi:hypothetical protein